MRRLATAATAALLCACARDLEVPLVRTLTVAPAFAARAPRERLTFAASGGAGAYRFAFAPGSPLSGPGATLDPVTGAYQAGSGGAAQDTIDVTDAAGVTVRAVVAVGAPLRITPKLTGTAPGGHVTFTATGGRPPYAFFVPAGASTVDAATGAYVAGPAGDAVDRVAVVDATRDALARDEGEVRVGRALSLYRASVGAVAPLEVVDVVALGGEPPYAYALASAPSGGAVDPSSGRYAAGAAGDVTDVIRATDANGETADLPVPVGPALALRLLTPDPRPGAATRLLATGGKPPYAFGHARHGNRSRGAVDSVTGAFVPGAIPGAEDLLEVRDAAGARASLPAPARIGAFQAHPGAGVQACVAGDFDGDGRDDLALAAPYHLATFGLSALTGAAAERLVTLPLGGEPWAVDLNRDGRSDLLLARWPGVGSLLADATGAFFAGPSAPGTEHVGAVAVSPSGDGYLTTEPCTAGVDPGLLAVTLPVLGVSIAPACVAVPTTGPVSALASGRFLGGDVLAWTEPGAPDRVMLLSGDLVPVRTDVVLPAGRTLRPTARDTFAALEGSPYFPEDGVALLVDGPGGRTEVAVVLGRAVAALFDPTALDSAWQGPPAAGLRAASGRRAGAATGWDLVAWSGVDGRAFTFHVDRAGVATPTRRAGAEFASPISCALLADVNGDGLADLAVAGAASRTADVLLGSPGGYGGQVHFPRTGEPGVFVDVDGDGLADWLEALPGGRGLRTAFGGGAQLAEGAEALLSETVVRLAAAPLPGGGATAVFQDPSFGLHAVAVAADGTPGVPVALVAAEPGGAPFAIPGLLEAEESMSGDTGGFTLVDAGGVVPNGDVFWRERPPGGSRIGHLLVRGAGGAAVHVATRETPIATSCRLELLAGPDGRVAQAVAGCKDALVDTTVHWWRAAFAPGPTPAFGDWVAEPDTSFADGGGLILRAALPGMRPWAAFVAEDALLADGSPRTTLIAFGAAGGPALATYAAGAAWYAAGDLDGDGAAELLLSDGLEGRVARPSGAGVAVGAPFPLAAGQGRLVPLAVPGRADLVTVGADLVVLPL